jgi:hemerythrin-like domain-containing protein
VLKRSSLLQNPFSFLFTRATAEEQVVAYLTREHRRGRSVTDIFTDRYVQNRLTPVQQARLLERPELVQVLGEHDVAAAREAFRTG